MIDWIVIGILAIILGVASGYVYKAKKSGRKCIGCPDGSSCGAKCRNPQCTGCSSHKQ